MGCHKVADEETDPPCLGNLGEVQIRYVIPRCLAVSDRIGEWKFFLKAVVSPI